MNEVFPDKHMVHHHRHWTFGHQYIMMKDSPVLSLNPLNNLNDMVLLMVE